MPAPVEIELQRRLADNTLVAWLLNADGTDPVRDADAAALLASILAKLQATLTVGLNPTLSELAGNAAALNADALSADVSAWRWLALQVTGTWVGTLTFQGSNDNATWVSVSLMSVGGTTTAATTTTTGNGMWAGPVNYKFFRVRMTAFTSGTAAARAEMSAVAAALTAIGASTITAGTVASGSTDSGNPVKVGGKASSAAPASVTAGQRVDGWFDLKGQAVVEMRDSAGTEVGTATAPLRTDPTGGTAQPTTPVASLERKLLDYDTRSDGQPVYVGFNTRTALVAATTWIIYKLFYDASNRLLDVQVVTLAAWSQRTAVVWRSPGGD